ncbi:alpha/beta fold hydrolase [Gilliamella sp. B14448G11]|nr:alpha/beta fold hydrolase [Gilliamella sp. B14448G7]MBI0031380.1 alpha/beta fold hydrolase [Gilliamella sp. B14384G15]MBI0034769.1 alpha/beta fold hydrolase [Gilliamella sp. B14448G11]MBI0042265.1 alpha/beta fold hydrolase [Gilliamella sp. B14448G12]MBI0058685.1 alpha/beta fold hydrolase [Gilliamella sp. B14384G12]
MQDLSYFLPGNKNGVLLIHGLTGTPNEMRILANGLHKAGFTVYAIQLAGHCGTEADLCKTSWQDWYQSVQEGANYLAQHVDNVFVAGLSMGALLALKLAADRPDQIKGVGVLAPTFYYDGWSMPFWAKKFFFLLVYFKKLGIFQKVSFIEKPPYGLKDERIRAVVSESMLNGDAASAGLAGNPFPALAEMQLLAKNVRAQLSKVVSPCLIMHSGNDDIANIETNAKLVEKHVSGSKKLVILNESYHLITIDSQRREVIKECITFFNNIAEGIEA